MWNFLSEQKNVAAVCKSSCKNHLYAMRKKSVAGVFGISSYAAVFQLCDSELHIDTALTAPSATLDSFGVIGADIQPPDDDAPEGRVASR